MTERININLGNVQKTLFLPLWGRAKEMKKKKPILVDHTAARIRHRAGDFPEVLGSQWKGEQRDKIRTSHKAKGPHVLLQHLK